MMVDLLRHGATGRAGYIDGRSDWPLTDAGWHQMQRQTAGRRWVAIVASPLRRAREPAEQVARALDLAEVVDPDWAEVDFGDWDGRSRSDVEATPGGAEALTAFYADPASHPPPGGEPWSAFETRVAAALERVAGMDGPVLVISHGGPIRMALARACGLPLDRLWALRIGYGTRVRLHLDRAADGQLWGEIVEIAQP